MRAFRTTRVLVPLVVVGLLAAGAVLVLSSRPDLHDAEQRVDRTWTPLRTSLDARYTVLAAANEVVRAVPGPVHDLVGDVDVAISRWNDVRRGSVGAQVRAANELEALGRRLVLAARASPRVTADAPATRAIDTFARVPVPAEGGTFDAAVHDYERERAGPLRHIVASLIGYGSISAFDTSGSP